MLNEGIIVNDAAALVKSEMVRQIRRLGSATPDDLERAVFKALTGHEREEVDWDLEDNQAGYYTWLRSFDDLVSELVEDGHIVVKEPGKLAPTEAEPHGAYSHLVYPSGPSG
ncbi:MAG: hypothetical protein HQ582_31000 [Planctomycetes bacterium]|nr:hypothetical protein [Planctomycetota bacterium]